jgi:hypothetical protein
MKRFLLLTLSALATLAGVCFAQTPTAAFFQPERNVAPLAALGVTHFFGPEVENAKNLSLAQLDAKRAAWVRATQAAKVKCVLKNWVGDLPDNCVGVVIDGDELNGKINPATGKQWQPAEVAAEVKGLRDRYPGVPVFASLAGDKVTDVKETNRDYAQQVAYYKAWGDLVDVLTVDNYPKNRNTKYSVSWPAQAAEKLIKFSGKPVWVWFEVNDQNLNPPTGPGEVNREPFPDEIQQEVEQCLAVGVKGVGWFLTCQKGSYGWGVNDPLYPARGDSYWPLVNRKGESLELQYRMVERINRSLQSQPSTVPTTQPATQPVDAVTARLDALAVKQQETNQRIDALTAEVKALTESVKKPRTFKQVEE